VERRYVLQGFKASQPSLGFVMRILRHVKATTYPVDAVREATLASSAVFAAIFNHKEPSEDSVLSPLLLEIMVGEGLSTY